MGVQYVVDENGVPVAAVVPIREWEALKVLNIDYVREELTPEAARAADEAWNAYQAGQDKGAGLDELERELLGEPRK